MSNDFFSLYILDSKKKEGEGKEGEGKEGEREEGGEEGGKGLPCALLTSRLYSSVLDLHVFIVLS